MVTPSQAKDSLSTPLAKNASVSAPSAAPKSRIVRFLQSHGRRAAGWVVAALIGALLTTFVPKLFEARPRVVAYYRGGGKRLAEGQRWVVPLRRDPNPPPAQMVTQIRSVAVKGVIPEVLPYFIGPFEITNEGDAIAPKEPTVTLQCSKPFVAYGDPGVAPTDPRPTWALNATEVNPLVSAKHQGVYRYKKHMPGPRTRRNDACLRILS